jgi:hypothetical protein
MELRSLTLRPKPSPPKGLFKLPRELRDQVYRYCLVELPKWERRHGAFCKFTPRDTVAFETPPWSLINNSVIPRPGSTTADYPNSCSCAKRKGLSLLGVSRRIHHETAPILWSENVFCWITHKKFTENISSLREEYQQLIRRVSVMTDGYEGDTDGRRYGPPAYAAFWTTVRLLRGLTAIEIRPEYVTEYFNDIQLLKTSCPKLGALTFHRLHYYDCAVRLNDIFHMEKEAKYLWVKATKDIALDFFVDAEATRSIVRSFRTNFCVHANFASQTKLLGRPESVFGQSIDIAPYKLRKDLDDACGIQHLELRDKTTAEFTLYGQPLSRATRMKHVRERYLVDLRAKQAGQLTAREEKLKREVSANRREKNLAKKNEAMDPRVQFQMRQNWRREEEEKEKEEKKEARARKREEREEEIRMAALLKVSERRSRRRKSRSGTPSGDEKP